MSIFIVKVDSFFRVSLLVCCVSVTDRQTEMRTSRAAPLQLKILSGHQIKDVLEVGEYLYFP